MWLLVSYGRQNITPVDGKYNPDRLLGNAAEVPGTTAGAPRPRPRGPAVSASPRFSPDLSQKSARRVGFIRLIAALTVRELENAIEPAAVSVRPKGFWPRTSRSRYWNAS